MYSAAEKMRLSEPATKIWMKIGPHYQRQKCRPMTLLSSDIRFKLCRYSRKFPGEGRQTTVGLSTTAIFSVFAGYFFGSFRDEASIMIQRYESVVCFSRNAWPWVTFNGCLALNCVFGFAPISLASDRANFENNCVKIKCGRPSTDVLLLHATCIAEVYSPCA